MKDNRLFRRLVLSAIVVWMALFAIAPNLLVLLASLGHIGETTFVAPGLSLLNYRRLLEPAYGRILLSSLYLAGGVTLICLICGYPFAAILARIRAPWRNLLLLLVVIPFWTNSLVRTYAMIAILNANGIVNHLLLGLGLIATPLPMMYTSGAVLAGLTYTLLPFMVLPLYAALERLDPRHVEAARDLGATPARTFVHVVLPLTMPGIVSGCMLVFLPAIGMFYVADVLGGARSMLLGNFIRDQFLTSRDWPFGAAASMGLTLVMGLMLLLYWRSNARLSRREWI